MIYLELDKHDNKFKYMLLGRCQEDCKTFINCNIKHLWGITIRDHIKAMKDLYNNLEIKPEWLTMDEILEYEKQMKERNNHD